MKKILYGSVMGFLAMCGACQALAINVIDSNNINDNNYKDISLGIGAGGYYASAGDIYHHYGVYSKGNAKKNTATEDKHCASNGPAVDDDNADIVDGYHAIGQWARQKLGLAGTKGARDNNCVGQVDVKPLHDAVNIGKYQTTKDNAPNADGATNKPRNSNKLVVDKGVSNRILVSKTVVGKTVVSKTVVSKTVVSKVVDGNGNGKGNGKAVDGDVSIRADVGYFYHFLTGSGQYVGNGNNRLGYGVSVGYTNPAGFGLSISYLGFNDHGVNNYIDTSFHLLTATPSYRFALSNNNQWGLRLGLGWGLAIADPSWGKGDINLIVVPQLGLEYNRGLLHLSMNMRYLHQLTASCYGPYTAGAGPLGIFIGGGAGLQF